MDRNFLDLAHVAELAQGQPLIAATSAPAVVNALAEGGAVVLWEDHGPGHPDANGLSIYYPHDLNGRDHCQKQNCGSGWVDYVYDDPDPSPTLYSLDAAIRLPQLVGQNHALADDPGFDFVNDHTWDEFLHRYYKPVADGCIRWGGACSSFVIVPVGTTVTLSGEGSSDSDGPEDDNAPSGGSAEFGLGTRVGQGNDVPAHSDNSVIHWYWDLDTTIDSPNPLPNYQPGVQYLDCSEDCDRDEVDSSSDDPDAQGRTVDYTCNQPGFYPFNLMVWDEHNDLGRMHSENMGHNNGRHWLHFNVDADPPLLLCLTHPFIPIKVPDKDVAIPGDTIKYVIHVPANTAATGTENVTLTDQLSDMTEMVPESLQCDGACSYDEPSHTISFSGSVDPGGSVAVQYDTLVPEELPIPSCPPEIINRATVDDGIAIHELEATVTLDVPCTQPLFIDLSTMPPGAITPGDMITASTYITTDNAITATSVVSIHFATQAELGYPNPPTYNFSPTGSQLQIIGGIIVDVGALAVSAQSHLTLFANGPGVVELAGLAGGVPVTAVQNTQAGNPVQETLVIDSLDAPFDAFRLFLIDPIGNQFVVGQWGLQFVVLQE